MSSPFNFLLRLLLLLLVSSVFSPLYACDLRVQLEHYPPLSYLNENNHWQGMNAELAAALLNETGCSYQFVAIPWGRAIEMIEKGQVDMMLNVSKTPQRQKFIHFIGPQRIESIALFSLTSNPITLDKWHNLAALRKPIAVHQGVWYGKTFAQRFSNDLDSGKHFIVVPRKQIKMALLRKGRISGFIDEKLNVQHRLKHNPELKDMSLYPLIIHTTEVYYGFSRATVKTPLLTRIKQAHDRLQQRKVLETIVNKFE